MHTPGVVIDDSPTRVQTDIKIDMEIMGTLRPKSVSEISSSRWTLDCGGMDREHADWRAVRGYVAPLGIARIRQQAGWARCEKDPGMYDFAWLDQCVLDAKRMGVDVWMELSYGNPAYEGGGGRHLNAGFPSSEEGLAAWDRWVRTIAEHYKGVVIDWCIWNEPNGKTSGNTIEQATDFAVRTAEILRGIIPDARIAAFALTEADPKWIEPFVKELEKRGKAHLFNTIAYHHYKHNPDAGYEEVEESRRIVARHTPNIRLMQGEGGTQSEWCRNGALSNVFWTELTQAKYDLRRSLGDLGHGDDTEVFHLCDLEYRAVKRHYGLLRYGLLKTAGQADGFRVLKVKNCVVYDWKDRETDTPVVVFWDASAMPSNDNITRQATVSVAGNPIQNPVWVDLLTGNVYKIEESHIERSEGRTVYTVPVYDSPAFITSQDILALDQSWFVREGKNMKRYH